MGTDFRFFVKDVDIDKFKADLCVGRGVLDSMYQNFTAYKMAPISEMLSTETDHVMYCAYTDGLNNEDPYFVVEMTIRYGGKDNRNQLDIDVMNLLNKYGTVHIATDSDADYDYWFYDSAVKYPLEIFDPKDVGVINDRAS